MFETGAFLLNEKGNIDRLRTDDGAEYRIESTLSVEAANNANTAAEAAKDQTAKSTEAETARAAAETARVDAEKARATAEEERASSEEGRKNMESERANSELARSSGESERVKAEDDRKKAEVLRAAAEDKRSASEDARTAAEAARVAAESDRLQAEVSRASAERVRTASESAREEAESLRAQAQQKNNADQALNNEAMKKLSPVILTDGQYNPDTLSPTIGGEPNRVYLVPMAKAMAVESGNIYAEWMWIGGKWELMGQATMKHKAISTNQIDSVFAGDSPSGDETLTLTGLSYLYSKEEARTEGSYARQSHQHSASTQSAPGFMSAADKKKLDGIAAGANAYSLPTGNGGTKGGVKLSDSTTSTSNANGGVAATPAAVKAVKDSLTSGVLYRGGGFTVWRFGMVCGVNATKVAVGSGSWDNKVCPYTLPADLRPKSNVNGAAIAENGGSATTVVSVDTNGVISVRNQGNAGTGNARSGSVAWLAGA